MAQTNPSALIGTNWKLIELDGKSVLHSGFESHFALKAIERGVGWSTGQLVNASEDGCNDLAGFYVTNGDSLRINPSHTMLLLCTSMRAPAQQEGNSPTARPGPCIFYRDCQPNLFIVALKKTSGYRIHGSNLELMGPNGTVLARMEATRTGDLQGRRIIVPPLGGSGRTVFAF